MPNRDADCFSQLVSISEIFVADFERGDAFSCADVYTEDAIILTDRAVIGRDEIVGYLQSMFERGYRFKNFTTTYCRCEGTTAWAIQTVHSSDGDSDILVGLWRDDDGVWYIDAEMSIGLPGSHEARLLFAEAVR